MAADDETPPATPAGLNPSLYTIARQLQALSKQVHAIKVASNENHESTREVLEKTVEKTAEAVRSSVAPPARPSMTAKAASTTKGFMAAIGGLAALVQIVSLFYPNLEGPLGALLASLKVLVGGGP